MPNRSPHRRLGVLAIAAAIAIVVGFGIATVGTINRRHAATAKDHERVRTDRVICLRVNKLYVLIQQQVSNSLKTNPQLAYYKKHPAELKQVQDATRQEVTAFAPKPCPKDGD